MSRGRVSYSFYHRSARGSLDSPPEFVKEEAAAPWYVGLRALDRLRLRYDPLLRATYAQASCVVGMAPYVKHLFDGITMKRFEIIGDNAIKSLAEPIDRSNRTGRVHLVYAGRVIRTKGVRDLVRAMGTLTDLPVTLDVLGNGGDLMASQRLALELGVADRINFHGFVSRDKVDEFYRKGDILVFPSYREPNGLSVIEGMGYGLPPVVCDRGGPAFTVDDTSGIRVPALNPKQFAEDLAEAIRGLVQDRGRRLALGEAARRRAQSVGLWPVKIDEMDGLYQLIINRSDLSGSTISNQRDEFEDRLSTSLSSSQGNGLSSSSPGSLQLVAQ